LDHHEEDLFAFKFLVDRADDLDLVEQDAFQGINFKCFQAINLRYVAHGQQSFFLQEFLLDIRFCIADLLVLHEQNLSDHRDPLIAVSQQKLGQQRERRWVEHDQSFQDFLELDDLILSHLILAEPGFQKAQVGAEQFLIVDRPVGGVEQVVCNSFVVLAQRRLHPHE
jgi:hypothetical protein